MLWPPNLAAKASKHAQDAVNEEYARSSTRKFRTRHGTHIFLKRDNCWMMVFSNPTIENHKQNHAGRFQSADRLRIGDRP